MQRRSFTVNYTSPNGKFAKRYPALANVPFILDSSPRYHRVGSAFLIDRALALWGPKSRGDGPVDRIPAPQSIHTYAQWLANFLEWSSLRSVDIYSCSYAADVAGRYQSEMLSGLWSRDGEERSANTANARVQQACEFLTWLGDTGKREPFVIPYTTKTRRRGSASSSIGHASFEVRVREGRAKPKKRSLQMPTDQQVSVWLSRVYERSGLALGLMCETILLTAMRREEVVSLHADSVPQDRSKWVVVNPLAPVSQQQIRITLKYGTKGQCYGFTPQGDKIGPQRDILVPLTLAEKWHAYRRRERNGAFAKWMKDVKGAARQPRAEQFVHLFVRDSDGARFSGPMLYDAWTAVERPLTGWSPHDGRHWWACSVLWRELKTHPVIKDLSNETAVALLDSTVQGIIKLQIQPQLGHADDATTMLYLAWVRQMVALPLSLEDDAATDVEA